MSTLTAPPPKHTYTTTTMVYTDFLSPFTSLSTLAVHTDPNVNPNRKGLAGGPWQPLVRDFPLRQNIPFQHQSSVVTLQLWFLFPDLSFLPDFPLVWF